MGRRCLAAIALVVVASVAHAAEPLLNVPVSVQVLDEGGQPVSGGAVYFNAKSLGKGVQNGWASEVRDKVQPGRAIVAYTRPGLAAVRQVLVDEADQSVTATIRLAEEPVAEGQVVTTDGQPIAGAHVGAQAVTSWSPPGAVKSDNQGRFRLDGYWLDGTPVDADAEGFIQSLRARIVEPFPTVMRFTLLREATVGFRITDAGGTPIPGAAYDYGPVAILEPGPFSPLLPIPHVDSEGNAEIHGVRPGRVTIAAYAPGYETQIVEREAAEGQHVTGIQFRLRPARTAAVSGVVVGPDGWTPIAGATVTLTGFEGPAARVVAGQGLVPTEYGPLMNLSYRATSDEMGRFEVRPMLGRYHSVQAQAAGYLAGEGVPLAVAGPISSLRIQLLRGGRVQGTVPGAPLPKGIRVNVWPVGEQRSGEIPTAQVDPDTGRFVFERVRPGPVEVVAAFPDRPAAVGRLEVVEGATVEATLQSLDETQIAGTVVDARDGSPVPMASVSAVMGRYRDYRAALTDENGAFRLAPMTAGEISVMARRLGFCEGGETLDASAGGAHEVRLELSRGGRVEGQLPEALAGARHPMWVSLDGESHPPGCWADDRGRFVFTHVPPGSYTLHAAGPGGEDAAKPAPITVREGETTRVVVEGK